MQSFAAIFVLKMPGRHSSYESACGILYNWAGLRFGWTMTPHPSGLQRARKDLTVASCLQVLQLARDWAYRQMPKSELCPLENRPLVGIDGTILHLKRSSDLVRRFGLVTDAIGKEMSHYPQALLVSAWDLARRVPLTWVLQKRTTGERAGLLGLLPALPSASILLLDRGYPGREILGDILDAGHDVVMRMVASKSGAWKEVSDFLASGKRNAIVPITIGLGRRKRTISVRLVLRAFERGRPRKHQGRKDMVILTTLTQPLEVSDLAALYQERWGIETIYREMKTVGAIEQWHGTTRAFVEQEIIALMTWFTIAAVIQAHAQKAHEDAAQFDRRLNTNRTFETITYVMEAIFMASATTGKIAQLLMARADEGLRRLQKWAPRRRPGRSESRIPKHPYARSTEKSRG